MTGRPKPRRVTTAIRFSPVTHEILRETADELGVGINWLVNKLVEEGLDRIDLTAFSLVRTAPSDGARATNFGGIGPDMALSDPRLPDPLPDPKDRV